MFKSIKIQALFFKNRYVLNSGLFVQNIFQIRQAALGATVFGYF